MMRLCAPLGAMLVITACVSPRAGTTWEEDRRDGVEGWQVQRSDQPLVAIEPKRSLTLDDTTTPAVDYGALAHEIELGLLRFTSQRRAVQDALGASDAETWPQPMVKVFEEILTIVERGMKTPHGAMPKRVLIQTRVTLEVEVDKTRHKYGTPPDTIVRRVQLSFVQVALHMRASRRTLAGRALRRSQNTIDLGWPLTPLIVTSPYGYRRDPILGEESVRFHAGVDLGGREGDVVSASGPGRIVAVGWSGGHGRMVVVQHAGGYRTMYAHLKRILVGQGAEVHRGSPIGLVGSTGRSTGPHLHFEVMRGSVPLDPMDAVGLGLGSVAGL